MKIVTITLGVMALLATSAGFSCEHSLSSIPSYQNDVVSDKIYVTREMIHIAPEGMYLCVGDELFKITTLGVDSNGLFINEAEMFVSKTRPFKKEREQAKRDAKERKRERRTIRTGPISWIFGGR